ncbi:CPCC family cysteine-rich protein [Enterococcus wangshanyuanii]|uniref:Membrane protein n=1 Tax=Enterococcus wangshanyuanii TaxID=2005703 RepID=A0ABQ1PG75_9ENTE|nr:CPCC family cysteine-rich protein [Enterococcus wangshanyuanii]GGC96593.1 membrane protein [Enterococcus wangshanyuanii]
MKQCPCCNNYTIEDEYDICEVCYWEKDIVAELHPNKVIGANNVSLNVAKKNYKKYGACEERFRSLVRKPFLEELKENNS